MKKSIVVAVMAVSVSSISGAWSEDGHQLIADIAWLKLTSVAQTKIGAILGAGEPTFRPIDGNVRDSFRRSAAFCDFIKGKKETSYEDVITKYNRFFDPKIDESTSEGTRCKKWHYYDVPIRFTGERPAVESSNAVAALALARKELAELNKSASDLRMQSWWLYWLEHVVGDLHQPLHCSSNHSVHANGDDGGNRFELLVEGKKRRLHAFWDGAIGRAIGRDREASLSPNVQDVAMRWTTNPLLQPSTDDMNCLTVMHWIDTGARISDISVYAGIKEGEEPNAEYVNSQVELAQKQAVLAGYRLAAVLNDLLK